MAAEAGIRLSTPAKAYCEQSYLATLGKTQNCTKKLRNVTFVVHFAYFCIRPNKRREKQKKGFAFLSNFSIFTQLSLQKVTFALFGATFKQLLRKARATFTKPFMPLKVKSPYLSDAPTSQIP